MPIEPAATHLAGDLGCLLAACVNIGEPATVQADCIAPENRPGFYKWPSEVRHFVEHRAQCDHVHGEEAHDAERRRFLKPQWQATCEGCDAELARLKAKYPQDSSITRMLGKFEDDIE